VDEVGMGCLAGPVVVCAVSFTSVFYKSRNRDLARLKESKLLNSRKREEFLNLLTNKKHLKYKLAYCYPKTIDKLNIYQASRRAMRRALHKLMSKDKKFIVLVDGSAEIKGVHADQIPIIKGDRKVFAIACASIIAKVFRDNMMCRYAKKFPHYGFEKHKGYGTKLHKHKLKEHGPCSLHRRSFSL
jgi:ribonuclease HII